ncbi:MAG: hypothetical protein AAB489_03055 [Patescibacteria group bacterium]
MTTLQHQLLARGTSEGSVVVDWREGDQDSLIEWLKASPEKQRIHVILPRSLHPEMRFFHLRLQSLGCTVTRRFGFISEVPGAHP